MVVPSNCSLFKKTTQFIMYFFNNRNSNGKYTYTEFAVPIQAKTLEIRKIRPCAKDIQKISLGSLAISQYPDPDKRTIANTLDGSFQFRHASVRFDRGRRHYLINLSRIDSSTFEYWYLYDYHRSGTSIVNVS